MVTGDYRFQMFYQNALMALTGGRLNSVDRDVLSLAPLPPDFIDPYAEQEVSARQAMELAYSAMVVWIEQAKQCNYFSKRFVQLSRLVMNGVTTMGRGLVSLHARGEDLSIAPMSIDDLISLASYHFRKSYLGVLQTAKSHPEVSERLLMNQLGWTNMLLRLYKTKNKLETPVSGSKLPAGAENAVAEPSVSGQLETSSSVKSISEPSGFREPGALAAPRAFTSLEGKQQTKAQAHRCPRNEAAQEDNIKENEYETAAGSEKNPAGNAEKNSSSDNSQIEILKKAFLSSESSENEISPLTGMANGSRRSEEAVPEETSPAEIQSPDLPDAAEILPDPDLPEQPSFRRRKEPGIISRGAILSRGVRFPAAPRFDPGTAERIIKKLWPDDS